MSLLILYNNWYLVPKGLAQKGLSLWHCFHTLIRSKGLHCRAMQTKCIKIILGSQLPRIIFMHFVLTAFAARPFERVNILVRKLPFSTINYKMGKFNVIRFFHIGDVLRKVPAGYCASFQIACPINQHILYWDWKNAWPHSRAYFFPDYNISGFA